MNNSLQALLFLVRTLGDLYILAFLLRFLLQWVRADFYNPLAQVIVRVTTPLVRPARRIIPSAGNVDLATLVILVVLEALLIGSILAILSIQVSAVMFVLFVITRLISSALWLYMVSIIILVVLSWIAPGGYHPVGRLLAELTEPLMRPARRLLPPMGGLDLSPMLVIIGLVAVRIALPLPPFLH
jgi:YggT family protein